jgi:hypothetical protein
MRLRCCGLLVGELNWAGAVGSESLIYNSLMLIAEVQVRVYRAHNSRRESGECLHMKACSYCAIEACLTDVLYTLRMEPPDPNQEPLPE